VSSPTILFNERGDLNMIIIHPFVERLYMIVYLDFAVNLMLLVLEIYKIHKEKH